MRNEQLNITFSGFAFGLCVGLVGGKTDAKPVLYEGGISRITLSSKHVKRKRKMSVGNN